MHYQFKFITDPYSGSLCKSSRNYNPYVLIANDFVFNYLFFLIDKLNSIEFLKMD